MDRFPVPLLFRPVYKDDLWGGTRLSSRFGRAGTPDPCAESWEASAHPDGMSVVEGGPFAGRTLASLCEEFGGALLGRDVEGRKFPVLVKLIDARDRLSVQVHPNDANAARTHGEPKTEMWYFLDAPEGAVVCAGLKKGVGPRIFSDAVKQGTVASLLNAVPAVPGKALFIPGGLVHAICEGCLVLEVQQSSNTTYRVHDWDRVGKDGKPRELHVAQAMETIDWKLGAMELSTPFPMPAAAAANKRERVVRSEFFTMERWTVREPEPMVADGASFRVFFAPDGPLEIRSDALAEPFAVPAGRTCLVPASFGAFSLAGAGGGPATALSVEV